VTLQAQLGCHAPRNPLNIALWRCRFRSLKPSNPKVPLLDAGIPVTEVSDYTGFPEMMDGRVKTLHPKIHGGLLGRRGIDDAVMAEHGIAPIDLVVVNLYPFEKTVADPDCDLATA